MIPGDDTSLLEARIDPWLRHMTWRRDFARWRERRINQEHYQHERLTILERYTESLDGLRLLDLGAGMGGFAVAAALRGAHVVAGEYNRAYCDIIALRAERHNLRLPVFTMVGESLPLPNSSFDCVVCWDVIEHVQSPPRVLSEISRVLKDEGCAIVTVINRRAWVDPHYHMRGINWLPRPVAEWLIRQRGRSKAGAAFRDMQRLDEMHYYHYDDFVALAQQHGFHVLDVREDLLLHGRLTSLRRSRRIARTVLCFLGLEHQAYLVQRRWYMGMFELVLWKHSTHIR